MYGIIYKVTGPMGLLYIGQTTESLKKRKGQHAYRMKKGDKRSPFQAALLALGFSSFTWEQIDTADTQEELDEKERYYIALYKSDDPAYGYNSQNGGTHYTPSAEHRRKIGIARKGKSNGWKGRHLSEEHRRKISVSMTGKSPSLETRQKLSEAGKGKKHNKETRRKISLAQQRRWARTKNRN